MALLHVTRSNTRNARPSACVVGSGHKTMHEAEAYRLVFTVTQHSFIVVLKNQGKAFLVLSRKF